MSTYYKLGEASKLSGLCKQTIAKYAKTGKIKFIQLPGGKQKKYDISTLVPKVEPEELSEDTGEDLKRVCYCRVSTHGQRDDLNRQIKFMSDKYPEYEIVSDVGSGINFKRKGLNKIIDYAIQGTLETLIVAYKDRLCRIGYDLIEHILVSYSNTEIIVDSRKEETINDEIANDILQIITVYSAKINGMRSYSLRKTKIM